jgi:Asp-tRNA(Asn)/Glu-tRNA(Gln) amidotransferase A subunit family amidase
VRTASGSYGYADFIPGDDDAAVERIKAADAIVIGKTQVPEFGYSGTGQTPLSVSASPGAAMFTRIPCARFSRARACQRLLRHEARHVPVVHS